ncbi:unnamed protein product [Ectocarpus sp. CCAP 1310/34]|nr:unnamed protein product [Ectocarpus sp. CCAP 1310/34]
MAERVPQLHGRTCSRSPTRRTIPQRIEAARRRVAFQPTRGLQERRAHRRLFAGFQTPLRPPVDYSSGPPDPWQHRPHPHLPRTCDESGARKAHAGVGVSCPPSGDLLLVHLHPGT